MEQTRPLFETGLRDNLNEIFTQVLIRIAPAVDDENRVVFRLFLLLNQFRFQFGKERDNAFPFAFMMFGLRRTNGDFFRVPVDVGPAQKKRFRRAARRGSQCSALAPTLAVAPVGCGPNLEQFSQAANSAQGHERSPFLIGTRFEQPLIIVHGDIMFAVLVNEGASRDVNEYVVVDVTVLQRP